ncbi:MAG: hypothetical protein ACRC5C_02555, partial [Bacilli bacterium]
MKKKPFSVLSHLCLTSVLTLSLVSPAAASVAEVSATEVRASSENVLALRSVGKYSVPKPWEKEDGIAEIIQFNTRTKQFIVVSGGTSTVRILGFQNDSNELQAVKTILLKEEFKDKIPNFNYGDVSSVAVSPTQPIWAFALQNEDFKGTGRIVVMRDDNPNTPLQVIETGVQPDMITFSKDGRFKIGRA